LEIWRIAKENDLVNVLIFEDDVTFVDWKNEALSEAIAHIATIDW
jgi:GR25 family glycosyltransferase involved in LPS biosynthesis